MPTLSLDTAPDLVNLAATYPATFPYLLQSSGEDGWDILFALPSTVRCYAAGEGDALFADLAAIAVQPAVEATSLPFTGGWVTYLAYEWLERLEPSVPTRDGDGFPIGLLARVPAAVLVSRSSGLATLVAETDAQLALLAQHCASIPPNALALQSKQPLQLAALEEDPPQAFLDGVARCKQYIVDGDVFQVNLSRGWQATLPSATPSIEVFARLRQANPAPFSAYLHLGLGRAIVSSSPERLVRIDRVGRVETRPIAGTHPRMADPQEDAQQKARLLASGKERAEHIMLIDLERNDLGRIAVPGTVKVDALMEVTTYTYVHHLESTVSCQIAKGHTVADVLRALFPGGTITGCPKVRCMQIIRELEDAPRRAYTGSLGYLNLDGSLDLNILIRTFVQDGDRLYFRAGAGIVADSDPERELNETRAKARGLLRALGVA